MQPGDPPYAPAAFHKFTKNRKARKPTFRRPCTATHAWLLPTSLGSPYEPCSHMFPRIPHATHKIQRIRPQIRRDQRPAPQIKRRPAPTDSTDLRRGWRRHLLHVCVHLHVRALLHGYARTCTAMGIPARPWPYPNGTVPWSHTHGMPSFRSSRFRAQSRRDQRPVSANPQPVWSRKFTGPATGLRKPTHPTRLLRFHRPTPGGHVRHRFAMRRRQRRRCVGVDVRGASTCMCDRAIGPKGPIMVRPEGRTDGTPEGQPASSGLIIELSGLKARLQSSLKA